MAIVLTVHIVETVWSRSREIGLKAPFLVVDHNGEQQQTGTARGGAVTVWNEKARFPYVPTADLTIMAFDAGHEPGGFVGQAEIDVAAMLQAGRLSGSTALLGSAGTSQGLVVFDLELVTSSKALALSLDLPSLTLADISNPPSPTLRCSSPFARPEAQSNRPIGEAAEQGRTAPAAAIAPIQSGFEQLVGTFSQGIDNILGFTGARRKTAESATAIVGAGAVPSMGAAREMVNNSGQYQPWTAGAGHRSFMRASSSFVMPSAPPYPQGISYTHNSSGTAAAAATPAALTGAPSRQPQAENILPAQGAAPAPAHTVVFPDCSMADGGFRNSKGVSPVRLSDVSNRSSKTSAGGQAATVVDCVRASDNGSDGWLDTRQASGSGAHSPLTRARQRLQLVRKGLHQQQQQQMQHVQVQQQQPLPQQQNLQQLAQQLAEVGLKGLLSSTGGQSAVHVPPPVRQAALDDALSQQVKAADAVGMEATLYNQLVLQQAEMEASTAQLLQALAAQQQQETAHQAQLLAAIAHIGPALSPKRLTPHASPNVLAIQAQSPAALLAQAAAAVKYRSGSPLAALPDAARPPLYPAVPGRQPGTGFESVDRQTQQPPGAQSGQLADPPSKLHFNARASSAAVKPEPFTNRQTALAAHEYSSSSPATSQPVNRSRSPMQSNASKHCLLVPDPTAHHKRSSKGGRKKWGDSIKSANRNDPQAPAVVAENSARELKGSAAVLDATAADSHQLGKPFKQHYTPSTSSSHAEQQPAPAGRLTKWADAQSISADDTKGASSGCHPSSPHSEPCIKGAHIMPAYTCTGSGSDTAPYSYEQNKHMAAPSNDHWRMHTRLDAVPCDKPIAAFPDQSVHMTPSAPACPSQWPVARLPQSCVGSQHC